VVERLVRPPEWLTGDPQRGPERGEYCKSGDAVNPGHQERIDLFRKGAVS